MSDLVKNEKILIEEVKLIQDIIKRMASNSFNVKTWAITLIVATLLFKGNDKHIFIAFIPLFAFWYLDAYYLRQERLFREIHKWITIYRIDNEDKLFDFNPTKFTDKVQSTKRIMWSISILPFYGSIFLMLVTYLTILYFDYFESLFQCLKSCIGGN
ncbi:hypothetical protein [Aliarcobacter skirrowii]|uniref:hypothetical protein n=1 Tax=Aliarcobacter skirrowii TaxID=28200 RepID=UPI0029B56AA7|nr:hypothetical protein [Aliarcobacter skirrowii]MDX4039638.1 hypothetical protein [Aliarcobacter skirrowii]MDY0328348.1 hypothetical protein [Arcobacteraceae bacterium]